MSKAENASSWLWELIGIYVKMGGTMIFPVNSARENGCSRK
ncbi:hypothetical protein [Desulfosarcina sp. BuS5]|nr:hypothetical protein [Desulfosarcina sp. BuS5]